MFAKATRNFVREVDCGGDLIPVSSLNNLDKLQFLTLVAKKKKSWCWQKPKYHLLSLTLNDVLSKDEPINPVVVESDFAKYEGTFEDYVTGSIETSLGKINLAAGGRGVVKSQSSFGNLKRQEVDLQKLMADVKGRTINLHNPLLQQMLERKNEVLCILTERIVTTQKCLISEHIQTEEKMASMVGIRTKIIKVSVSEDGNVMKDSNVVLEIPSPTAIAYGVIELYIKHNGQLEFCLLHEQQGGFEKESMEGTSHSSLGFRDALLPHLLDAVDNEKQTSPESPVPSGASLSILRPDILQLKTQFQPFTNLSKEEQGALYQIFCELLLHEEMLTQLEDVLDHICSKDHPESLDMKQLKPDEEQNVRQFIELLGIHVWDKESKQNDPALYNQQLLLAAHILLSAVAELSDYALVLLRACCELQVIPALCCLPDLTSADGSLTLGNPTLAPLIDKGKFWLVQELFALSCINFEMTESSIRVVTMKKPRFFPFILYIALYGFHTLGYNTADA